MTDPAIAAAAPPNALSPDELRLRSDERGRVAVDPDRAGWRYLSFGAFRLDDGETVAVGGAAVETAIVLIAGGAAELALDGRRRLTMKGRPDPFEALPSGWYLPPGLSAELTARGSTRFAIASAPASGRAVGTAVSGFGPDDIRVEIRGAGNATRQINHIVTPDFPADRLELVEVLTPSGNWSSWPPHKHDVDDMPHEAVLEEIYYYRFARPEAWGVQRVYRPDRSRDALWEVRGGDLVVVTDGYHPFAATPGDDAYYLNALAGDRRTMACSFDPDLDWVRDTWPSMEPDPRVPLIRP